jgi:hypothetical protein
MRVEVTYECIKTVVYDNVLEIIDVPDTMNIILKCGFPHWETVSLIRKDIKKIEVIL